MSVRRVTPSRGSVSARIVVRPGTAIAVESTLERDFVLLTLLDPMLRSIEAQPCRIEWHDDGGRRRSYVPDFLTTWVAGDRSPELVEVKPEARLAKWCRERAAAIAAAQDHARSIGAIFRVVSCREIRTPRLENARWLHRFRWRQLDPGRAARILALAQPAPGMAVDDLLRAAWPDTSDRLAATPDLWTALARGLLAADLDQPLTPDALISLRTGRTPHGI